MNSTLTSTTVSPIWKTVTLHICRVGQNLYIHHIRPYFWWLPAKNTVHTPYIYGSGQPHTLLNQMQILLHTPIRLPSCYSITTCLHASYSCHSITTCLHVSYSCHSITTCLHIT
jgi:hypothetical protein